MIAFNFQLQRPVTAEEAIDLALQANHQSYKYVSGTTEFISRARVGEVRVDMVIDTKNIPACQVLEVNDESIIIGSAVSLNRIIDANVFPLLTAVCQQIATRTARNKITIGGNLCSHLPYKETMLPLLLAGSEILVMTEKGMETKQVTDLASLAETDFLVQIKIAKKQANKPFRYARKTKQSALNYPIITAAALKHDQQWHYAFSGLCDRPFYEPKMTKQIAQMQQKKSWDSRQLLRNLPSTMLDDMQASKAFRLALWPVALAEMSEAKGEGA